MSHEQQISDLMKYDTKGQGTRMLGDARIMGPIELSFGASAEPLGKQLVNQNIRVPRNEIDGWQADADAITRLTISGLISENSAFVVRRKLLKIIANKCREISA